MPISVRDYIRLSSAGGLGGAGGGVTLTQVQTEATTAATAVKTELSDADTAGKGASLIAYTKLTGETGVVAPQYPVGDVRRYGARGDGNSRPLSTIYGTLGGAQAVYPHATALTNELDWAAIQSAVENASARSVAGNQVRVFVPEGRYIVNRPVRMRHNVALIGQGSPLIESIYAGTDVAEKQCIMLGNFHPSHYTTLSGQTYNLSNITAGNYSIEFTTPAQAGNLTVGIPFMIRSTATFPISSTFVPYFHEANIPTNINIASGVVTLKYPIEENVTSPQAVSFHGNVLDINNEPCYLVKNINVDGITFKPNESQLNRWCGRWGAIECALNNLTILNSRDFLFGNMLCRSSVTNITGQFSNRALEFKSACSHTIFENIRGAYYLNTAPDAGEPLVSIGESCHSCIFNNIFINGAGWTGATAIGISFSYRMTFGNFTVVAPNATGAFMNLASSNDTGKLEDNKFINVSLYAAANFSRWLNVGTTGATVSVPKRYVFNNFKCFGTPNGSTSSSAMLLSEGEDFEFTDCIFEGGQLSPQNNTKRFKFSGCEMLNRTPNGTAVNLTNHVFRGGRLSAWKDCFRVLTTITAVNSTTANNIVATYTHAVGARTEDQDCILFSLEINANGTAGTKTVEIHDNTGAVFSTTIASGTTGLHRIDGKVMCRSNTTYVANFTLTSPAGTITTTRTLRGGLNISTNGRTFTVHGWVANVADSIDFDQISIMPVPLLGGMPV